MAYQDIEESRMYLRAERIADLVWDAVIQWEPFARTTVGEQMARAVDSIGANIAESSGRYHVNDVIRFLHFARGSMKETRYWLKRSLQRNLISAELYNQLMSELSSLGLEINSYIQYQRTRTLKESQIDYHINPPTDPSN
ncbi:MAG: four helix bundle protein [Caldilineales bacterium]|nr:four helix bundle protein [Caldilineales bacterium]